MPTLVIGYGNDLRSDDGVGPWFAHHLQTTGGPWEVVATRQLLPEHAERISQVDTVILIDAARDLPPGQTRWSLVEPAPESSLHAHRLDPPGLLALTHRVYGRAPTMWLISIGGEAWGFGETLSPSVQQAALHLLNSFPQLLSRVMGARHHA